jgi:tetratricopeptide (TPR) repeat protein
LEFNSIAERSRTIAGDTTRAPEERSYARKLLGWAANRRGELRMDSAGKLVRDRAVEEAEKLDRAAAADFLLAIEADPGRWRAHHNLGILRALAGDLQSALELFDRTLELNPKFSEAWFNRAELRAQAGEWAEAIADYNQAIELATDDAGLYTARGRAKSASGDLEGALADFRSALGFAPDSVDAAVDYADACQSLGDWKEAAEAYQQALKLGPDHPRALQNAAWMMASCPDEFFRNPESAMKTIQRAIDAKGSAPGVHMLHVLGVVQAANGEYSDAVGTMNEALQLTSDPSLRRELAQQRALFQRKKPYFQPQPGKP